MSENPYYNHNDGGDCVAEVVIENQQQNHRPAQPWTGNVIYNSNIDQQHQHHLGQPVLRLIPHGSKVSRKAPYRRQGHLCCGGCCDMRRAVIIVDSINLFLMTMALLSVLVVRKVDQMAINALSNQTSNYVDDEDLMDLFDDSIIMLNKSLFPFTIIIALVCIRLVSSTIGIIGALNYNTCLVKVTTLMYCIDIFFGCILLNPFDIIAYGLFAYPHFVLIREIQAGVMSPETYKNEEFCCCCV
jgi:hypothetical protein